MTGRGRGSRSGSDADADFTGSAPRARSPGSIRVSVLTALLLMSLYAAFQIRHLSFAPGPSDASGAQIGGDAALEAARVDGQLMAVQAALAAGREAAARTPTDPIDAADIVVRASGGAAAGAAVVDEVLLASSGAAKDADWTRAAAAAKASGKGVWVGGWGGWVYLAQTAPGPHGSQEIIAAASARRLLGGQALAPLQALATPDGHLLAIRCP